MQIEFKNGDLQGIQKLLTDLKIKGAVVNRARYQVSKLIEAKVKELSDSHKELLIEFCKKDASGNPIIKNGQCEIIPGKKAHFNAEFDSLMNENASLTIDDYVSKFRTLYDFMNSYDEELTGVKGYAYGAFLDELERVNINANDK